ncbi:MAG: hypothetical protein ABJD68_10560 [Nakamurella sp.]
MASRSGRRRVDHSSPLVDLDDVFADDTLIDAIAAGPWGVELGTATAPGSFGRFGTAGNVVTAEPLTELFGSWRLELASAPIPDPPAIPKVVDVVAKPSPKRSLRPALAIAAAIAALLVGSTFVGSRQATEGSALWNVTAVLWPDRVESVASRNKVRTAIAVAETALKQGRSDEAKAVLLNASFEIGKVDDVDGRQDLQNSLEGLWKKAVPDPPPASDQAQSVADGSPSSTARSSATPGVQQLAATEQPVVPLATPAPINALTTVEQIAGGEVRTDNNSGPAGPAGSAAGGGISPVGGAAGISAEGSLAPTAAAIIPVTPVNTPDADSGTLSAAVPSVASTPLSPTTDEPTQQSPTSGSTEPATAPTPTLPKPTAESAGDVPAAGSVGTADDAASTATDSLAADSTAVLPTP